MAMVLYFILNIRNKLMLWQKIDIFHSSCSQRRIVESCHGMDILVIQQWFSISRDFKIYLKKLATNIAWQHSVPSYVASRQKMVEK